MVRLTVREPLLEPSMPHKRPARKNRRDLSMVFRFSPVIIMKIDHFHPHAWPRQGHGNYYGKAISSSWVALTKPSVILAAAGIQSPDYVPRLLCQLRRTGWTGRRPTWNIPADTHQVGWGKGLWIPAAARITMALSRPHMRMKMAYFHSNDGSRSQNGLQIPVAARDMGDSMIIARP